MSKMSQLVNRIDTQNILNIENSDEKSNIDKKVKRLLFQCESVLNMIDINRKKKYGAVGMPLQTVMFLYSEIHNQSIVQLSRLHSEITVYLSTLEAGDLEQISNSREVNMINFYNAQSRDIRRTVEDEFMKICTEYEVDIRNFINSFNQEQESSTFSTMLGALSKLSLLFWNNRIEVLSLTNQVFNLFNNNTRQIEDTQKETSVKSLSERTM
jgi:hypothetical protein